MRRLTKAALTMAALAAAFVLGTGTASAHYLGCTNSDVTKVSRAGFRGVR
jgi:hypothetical protein